MKKEILGSILIVVMFFGLIIFTTWYEGGFDNPSEPTGETEVNTEQSAERDSIEDIRQQASNSTTSTTSNLSNQQRDPMQRNSYDKGQCTHYVFQRVKEDGNKIERRWRDAEHWAERADRDGYNVSDEPEAGSILQTEEGPIGHVAYVEEVYPDGAIQISEMNLYEAYEVTERVITAGEISDYDFIHPKENPHADDTEDT